MGEIMLTDSSGQPADPEDGRARPNEARPGLTRALSALGVALAYGLGLWLVWLNHRIGAHEHGETSLLVHWLRDSTLALPLVVVAVVVASALATRMLRPTRASVWARRSVVGVFAAVGASLVMGFASAVSAALFGGHGSQELSFAAQAARDTLIALPVALVLGLAVAALAVERRTSRRLGKRLRPRVVLITGIELVAGLAVFAIVAGVSTGAFAAGDPGSPCPGGTPLKQFSVEAIDVNITLNRFGDHYQGKMYALQSAVSAVRAQEQSG